MERQFEAGQMYWYQRHDWQNPVLVVLIIRTFMGQSWKALFLNGTVQEVRENDLDIGRRV